MLCERQDNGLDPMGLAVKEVRAFKAIREVDWRPWLTKGGPNGVPYRALHGGSSRNVVVIWAHAS